MSTRHSVVFDGKIALSRRVQAGQQLSGHVGDPAGDRDYMCRMLGVTRQGYYRWKTRRPSQRDRDDSALKTKIKTLFEFHQGRYGVRRIHAELRRANTHKYVHVAVGLDQVGAVIGTIAIPVDRAGYQQLDRWAAELGEQVEFGVEGSGSYGAGLGSYLRRRGHRVIEVNRPNRMVRHLRGKDDAIDAETAARSVLSGAATAVPKSGDGTVEMIRQVKIVKDTAVKARSQAIMLKTVIVNAPAELREQLEPLDDTTLIANCRALRYDTMSGPVDAACYTLRALAERYHALDQETRLHERVLATLTDRAAPALTSLFGVGADSAAELLVVVGDNPERIRSDAALAKLCGACPIPASSGKTTRHRLNRGGHRQANAALHRILIVRMRFHEPTITYVRRRTAEGKTKKEILRCLKRLLIREIYQTIVAPHKTNTSQAAA